MDLIFTRRTIHSIIRFDFHFFYVTQYSFLYQQREKRNILIFTKTCPTWKSSSRCHSKTKRHNIIHITYIHKRPVNKQKNIYIIVFGREKKVIVKPRCQPKSETVMTPENKRKKERNSYKNLFITNCFLYKSDPLFFVSYRLLIHMCFNTIPLVDGYKFTIFFFSGNQQFFLLQFFFGPFLFVFIDPG